MEHSDWVRIIRDVYSAGGRACQFIGGEPFLYRGKSGETVLDLVRVAKEVGFSSIEVFTKATLLDVEKIAEMKRLEVKVAVSLYSDDPNIHDSITNIPGSHAKTMESIRLLKHFDVQTRVEIVIMKANEPTIDSSLHLRETLGCNGKRPAPLLPSGRGSNRLIQPSFEILARYGLKRQPDFTSDISTLTHYVSGHSCLMGKLAFTEFGEVLPCVFSRGMLLGNILDVEFRSIVNGESVRRIWGSTKDDVMVCRDCEYRYVCHDCRPLSCEMAAGNASYLTAPYPRCTYNPYTGQWGRGVWRVDGNGKPFYVENLHQEPL
jgi:radical SAM protein with 4Fe4S-binding SPASM domain